MIWLVQETSAGLVVPEEPAPEVFEPVPALDEAVEVAAEADGEGLAAADGLVVPAEVAPELPPQAVSAKPAAATASASAAARRAGIF